MMAFVHLDKNKMYIQTVTEIDMFSEGNILYITLGILLSIKGEEN